ncbi:MAG TPA: hypothetical protein VFJ85_02235 [Acidimicrobiales bacterium]|nr:hypothetical protein [Acidimicrobiales bacterium]
MENIVAIAVDTDEGKRTYFLTWGRIQDPIDPAPLEAIMLEVARNFRTPGKPQSASVCATLQDAADAPYFYEYFFTFCNKPIPFGRGYKR